MVGKRCGKGDEEQWGDGLDTVSVYYSYYACEGEGGVPAMVMLRVNGMVMRMVTEIKDEIKLGVKISLACFDLVCFIGSVV